MRLYVFCKALLVSSIFSIKKVTHRFVRQWHTTPLSANQVTPQIYKLTLLKPVKHILNYNIVVLVERHDHTCISTCTQSVDCNL